MLFENALTPAPMTLPAHTSLLTGLLPRHHGVRDNGIYRVPDNVPTLASTLRQAGYDTAAVVGSAILDRQYGLARGFARYDDAVGQGGLAIAERKAGAVTDGAIAVARTLRKPFFLFVHYFDPHAAYEPPAPFSERFRADPYDGEIAYADEQVGRLRDALDASGLLDGTIVVVVSDHGESLGEHGEATHGVFLYQSTLHVPLIVVAPGRWPAGRRVAGLASLADVAPTLLELAGQPSLPGLDGRSLGALVAGHGADRWLPVESEFGYDSYGWAPLVGITDGSLKWIGAPEPELYDLARDPREDANVVASRAKDAERLAALWRQTAGEDRRSPPVKDGSDQARSERLERLAALGYTSGGGERPEHGAPLPDPKRVIGTLGSINDARRMIAERRYPEAEKLLESVIRQSPRNVSAFVLLGVSRISGGRPGAAVEPLTRAAELAPYNSDVQFNLGLAWSGRGDAARAEKAWRRTLALAPRYQDAAVNLVNMLMQTGHVSEAEQALEEARQGGAAGPLLDFLQGKLAANRGDVAAAREALTRALEGSLPAPIAADAQKTLAALPR